MWSHKARTHQRQHRAPPVIAEDISKKASLFLDRNSKEIERLNKLNENQIRDLNRKLKKIKQMRMDDELDREEYLEDKNEILSKISNLEEDHKKKIEDLDMRIEDFLDWLELMKSLSSWAKGMGPVLWGNILYSFGSNFLLKDGKIVIEQKTELFKAIESYSVQFGSSSTTMYELLSTFLRSDYYIKKMLNLEHSHSQSQQ